MEDYINMEKILPEGEKGGFAVRHFTLSKHEVSMAQLQAAFGGHGSETLGLTPNRVYTKLVYAKSGEIIMSNTPMEMMTNARLFRHAHGNVLIAGLGLGMVLTQIGKKIDVSKIVVIEKERAIIDLVWQHILRQIYCKSAIHCGDIFTYKENIYIKYDHKFDVIYFDIWDDVSSDNWAEMKKLKNVWRPVLMKADSDTQPWMSCWREDTVRYLAQDERRREKQNALFNKHLRRVI